MSVSSPLAAAQRDAVLRRDSGDLAGAISLLADILEWARSAYGEDHPEVLATAYQLAGLHRQAGDPAGARRVLEEALAAGQRRFDDGDSLLLAISFDLGTVAEELGNRHEARRNFGRVASAGPATLGPDHWTVRAAREYLGEDAVPADPAPSSPAAPPVHPQAGPRHPVSGPPDAPPFRPPAAPPHPVSGPAPGPVPGPPSPFSPAPAAAGGPGRPGRGTAITAAVAAVAAVAAAVLAAVAVLDDDGDPSGEWAAPTTPPVSINGDPPTKVRIARDGDALVLTWTDPAPGRASFVITGGKEGEELRFVGQLPSGSPPRFPVHGFNPELDYCFQIAAVYSTTELGVAQPVCTSDGGDASPGR